MLVPTALVSGVPSITTSHLDAGATAGTAATSSAGWQPGGASCGGSGRRDMGWCQRAHSGHAKPKS